MRRLSLLACIIISMISCGKDSDPFLIDTTRVGSLTKEIKINQLDSVFSEDSIVRKNAGTDFFNSTSEIEIFDKEGKPLLIIEPIQQFDTTSTVGYIQIMDPRFQTAKGLNSASTFGEVVKNYQISRIENTLNSAVVFIDELNLYLTIDKKDLPTNLRYDTDTRITSSQIPDEAKIKYLMVSW